MHTLAYQRGRAQVPVSKSNTSLSDAFRLLDDIGPREAALVAGSIGGDVARILEAGYGLVNPAFTRAIGSDVSIKRNSVIIPCRNARGEIVALHDQSLNWLTRPAPHIANPIRARVSQIEIRANTVQSDSVAIARNICVIGRNGCDDRAVERAILSALRFEGRAIAA